MGAGKVLKHNGTAAAHPQPGSATIAEFRLLVISLLAALIGITAGVVAYVLYNLIGLFTNLAYFHRLSFAFSSPRLNQIGWWVIVIPIVGGLIVGIMAKYGSPKIKGHGIPEAMEAVLVNRSRISPRVAILKPLSAAIAIGTGGPFGAEGPIIQTGGAIGSVLGQSVRMTASERKVLLACGAGAGMSATFGTPIAAVILAIELLLFEFKSRSFIPLVIASTLAATMREAMMGSKAMFSVGHPEFGIPGAIPYYLVLGVLCGIAAVLFSKALYWVEDQFEKLPVSDFWWPAIGALGLGLIGFFVPRVLGIGYDTISDILNARLGLELLLIILICKSVALVVSLGSGTSGGLLAPMFMSSAAMGAAFAMLVNHIHPAAQLSPGAFALVAMGAVFGAASRATFAFIIFPFELTRDYNSVLPLMLVCVIAEGIALAFTTNSIMTEKLARRGLRIHQDYEADVLQQVTVGDVMRVREHGIEGPQTIQASGVAMTVAYSDESLGEAVNKMLHHHLRRLPVVHRTAPGQVLGYVGLAEIIHARRRKLEEEHVREPGWLFRWRERDGFRKGA